MLNAPTQSNINTQNEMSEMDLEQVSAGADKITGELHGRNADGSGFDISGEAHGPTKKTAKAKKK